MKKVLGMFAMALALVACNKVETENNPVEQPSDSKAEGITITATLAPKTADTKAVTESGDRITVTWAKNEHIAILYEVNGTKYAADATITDVDGSGTATISFTVDASTPDNTACTLVYPASAAKDDHSGVKDAAMLLAKQNGTLNANLDVRVGAGKIQVTTPSLNVTTQPKARFAIFKFTVKNSDASSTIAVRPLVVTIDMQAYVIAPSTATSTLYAALPATGGTVNFFAKGSDNNTYGCVKSGVVFSAGYFYQSVLKLEPDALPGVFSVSATKKVKFSRGNLQATCYNQYQPNAWSWCIAANQFSRIGNSYANTSINGAGSVAIEGTVDLFGWSQFCNHK